MLPSQKIKMAAVYFFLLYRRSKILLDHWPKPFKVRMDTLPTLQIQKKGRIIRALSQTLQRSPSNTSRHTTNESRMGISIQGPYCVQKTFAAIGFIKATEKASHQGQTGIKRPLRHSIQKYPKGPQNSSKRTLFWYFVWEIEKATATKDALPLQPIRTCLIITLKWKKKRFHRRRLEFSRHFEFLRFATFFKCFSSSKSLRECENIVF
jgi:hypothetical protein